MNHEDHKDHKENEKADHSRIEFFVDFVIFVVQDRNRSYCHTLATGLLTRNSGLAPGLGTNFCTRPLSTSAT